jgi:hypothetical protein
MSLTPSAATPPSSVSIPASVGELAMYEAELLTMLADLKNLQSRFKLGNEFNIFDAVGVQRQEIRHSRFLSYLLDPRNPHGLGTGFVRAVLALSVSVNATPPVSALQVELAKLDDCTVYCERDRFDITIEIPSLKLLFVIENKVDAQESQGQLKKYGEDVQRRYSDFRFLGTLLTITGYEGEDSSWSAIGYGMVINALKLACEHATMAPDAIAAVRHYIAMVERNIVASQELVDACKALYKRHRAAIDLVVTHGQQSPLKEAFRRFASDKEVVAESVRSSTVYFRFRSWSFEGHPKAVGSAWPSDVPVLLWFELLEGKLLLRLEVGPFQQSDDGKLRAQVVAALKDKSQGPAGTKDVSKAVFTRVRKWSVPLNGELDEDQLVDKMTNLWSKANTSQSAQEKLELRVLTALRGKAT